MRKWKYVLVGLLLILYGWNASWLAKPVNERMGFLSHRGVHQTFSHVGLTNETCTAERINTPSHPFIENTLDSFQAAIDAGATLIELDVHPTTDGEFVVFHDWTLDCRTNGQGRTRDHSMAELKALDVGFGYTADGGETFPFRGQFVGAMPRLRDVFERFPETGFVINMKSRSKNEANALVAYIKAHTLNFERLSFTGHPGPMGEIKAALPNSRILTKQAAKACLKSYVLLGWSGYVPKACHRSYVPVPSNYRRLMWGWPHRFEARLNAVDSRSMLIGPMEDGTATAIDTDKDLKAVPKGYRGIVFTNKIETIGPRLLAEPKHSSQ